MINRLLIALLQPVNNDTIQEYGIDYTDWCKGAM